MNEKNLENLKTVKVFADAYQMTLTVYSRTKNFPKHLRPTLGRKLEESCLELTIALRQATFQSSVQTAVQKTVHSNLQSSTNNSGSKMISVLLRASDHLDQIRILLQMCQDMGLVTPGTYADLSAMSSMIGCELGGWIKYAKKKGHAPSANQQI